RFLPPRNRLRLHHKSGELNAGRDEWLDLPAGLPAQRGRGLEAKRRQAAPLPAVPNVVLEGQRRAIERSVQRIEDGAPLDFVLPSAPDAVLKDELLLCRLRDEHQLIFGKRL